MKHPNQAPDLDLIVYDFDGVMTDNRVLVFEDGTEAVVVNRADGLGINMIKGLSIPQIILSTETNSVVTARAKKIGIPALQGVDDKESALVAHCGKHGYDLDKVLYVGNDINDLDIMVKVGFPVAPADAHEKLMTIAKFTLKSKGGEGVVRELADHLMEF